MTPSSLARVLLLLLSCAVVLLDGVVLLKATAEQPSSSSFHPLPTIPSVQSLRSGAHDDVVKSAFFGKSAPGVLFVKGLNGFEKTREESLRRLSECATTKKKERVEEAKEDVFLRNSKAYSKEHPGVSRSTLAEFANKRLSMDVNAECAEGDDDAFDLRRELEKLRDFADLVSQATLPRLDAILNANEGEDANRRPTRMEKNFFSDALRSEASLDHFHVYASSDSSSSSSSSSSSDPSEKRAKENEPEKKRGKHEHTDVGVAIVMTPAWVDGKDDQAGSRGLLVDGVSYDIPNDGMLVLLGEAARAWHPKRHGSTRNSLLDEIKIPTHAVALEKGETRAWFGRMVLPNLSDEHPDTNVNLNFGEWLNGARALVNRLNENETSGSSSAAIDYVSAACDGLPATTENDESSVRFPQRRILADDGSCAEGTIYCWLSCQPIPTGCDASTAVCQESGTDKIWPDDFGANGSEAHCDSCAPACPAVPNENSNGQCNSNIPPTTMFMDGFSSGTDSNQPCVAFFFETWSLKSPGLVFAACLFTVFLGMSIELCAKLRRKVRGEGRRRRGDWTTTLLTLTLYAFQVTAGYLLMLVSMTYHAPLFISVILGLTLGHAVFSVYSADGGGKITAGTTACCAEARDDDDFDRSDRSNSLDREILREDDSSASPESERSDNNGQRRASSRASLADAL